jgi:hypothetical protein
MSQLISSVKFLPAITVTAGAAAATDITGTTIDTANFDGVAFVVQLGAIVSGAVTSLKVQVGDQSNMSDAADVTGLTLTVADTDDEDIKVLDYHRPAGRYVRLYCDRATQNATLSAIAQLYHASSQPASQTAASTVVVGVSG